VADGIVPPTDVVTRQVLESRGVSDERIILLEEGQTGHTHGDATLLAAFLESHPDARATVVTSHYHTRRARWAFSLVLGPRAGQVTFVSAPTDGFTAENWWRRQEGRMAVVGEYLKLAFYAVRYSALPYWIAVGILILVAVGLFRRRRNRKGLADAARPDPPGRLADTPS
jgi:uncharacterized SAM-binding protein YcdF (DUF218 family)